MDERMKPVHGSKFYIKVTTEASVQQLLSAAVNKRAMHDRRFNASATYMLLYSDSTPVVTLPESGAEFNLRLYKAERMEDYSKLKFYLISQGCYISVDY